MPFLGDLAKILRQQGGVSWDAARQLAFQVATGGESEPNVDPLERIRLEQLARVAELQVAEATGLATVDHRAGRHRRARQPHAVGARPASTPTAPSSSASPSSLVDRRPREADPGRRRRPVRRCSANLHGDDDPDGASA